VLPKSKAELDAIRDECKSMVTTRAGISGAAAVVPVPGADVGADITLLLEMIPTINRKFGLSPEQIDELDPKIKQLIFVTVTSVGSQMIGKAITKQLIVQILKRIGIRVAAKSVAKWIPILGQAAAATISFGAMKLVGNSHVDDCYQVVIKAIEAQQATSIEESVAA
jgi:uncharacterized protein (DUF697 family)